MVCVFPRILFRKVVKVFVVREVEGIYGYFSNVFIDIALNKSQSFGFIYILIYKYLYLFKIYCDYNKFLEQYFPSHLIFNAIVTVNYIYKLPGKSSIITEIRTRSKQTEESNP